MNKDVFLSYKSEDAPHANWVRTVLENNGISCWIAPECIAGGSSYAMEIPQAIHNCKAFVLILSSKTQDSKWVPRELDQAINDGKTILPFMLENFSLKDDYNFYLSNVQRYPAYENRVAAAEKMLNDIKALIAKSNNERAVPVTKPPVPPIKGVGPIQTARTAQPIQPQIQPQMQPQVQTVYPTAGVQPMYRPQGYQHQQYINPVMKKPRTYSKLALVSIILSVLSLISFGIFFPLGITGTVLGVVGIIQRKYRSMLNEFFSIVGIVVGIASFILGCVVIDSL